MNNLDLINSGWLIHMLKKSSNKPQLRLLNLFDILEDWLDAPYAQQNNFQQSIAFNSVTLSEPNTSNNNQLQEFLALEASKAGVALPEMLANQLYFMALAAAQEKIQAKNPLSLSHAKNAASALISAQTQKDFRIAKSSAYAIAASFVGALVVGGSLFIYHQTDNKTDHAHSKIAQIKPLIVGVGPSHIASAQQTSELIAQIDQMRKGNCQLIEALQLPDSYKKVYFENIVFGQISTNIDDQKLVHEMLQKVRCNYTPMLMANSIN